MDLAAPPGLVPGLAEAGHVIATPGTTGTYTSGASWRWDSARGTANGGQYRLCWCAIGYACHKGEQAVVDVGELYMVGPAPLV